ncbi:MAG: cAMP-binding proteins - catabolite gene activator and regulatory subunit of cAMP-dependent protein kinases, partial [uncultured Frankineae bacterium]
GHRSRRRTGPRRTVPGRRPRGAPGAGVGAGAQRLHPRRDGVQRGRAGRLALHRPDRQGEGRPAGRRRPREHAVGHGSVGHVRRAVAVRPRSAHGDGDGPHRRAAGLARPQRPPAVDQRPAGDLRAAAARARPAPAAHQRRPRRPDLHRRAGPRGQGPARPGRALRDARGQRGARPPRPHPGGARPARGGVPRDRQQGARGLRLPRLDARRLARRDDPRRRPPGPPRPL